MTNADYVPRCRRHQPAEPSERGGGVPDAAHDQEPQRDRDPGRDRQGEHGGAGGGPAQR